MPTFVLNRDHVLRTTLGYSVAFVAGVPVFVPREIERDAVAIGAECVDAVVNMFDDEPVVIEMSIEDRREKLLKTFKTLEARNGREDFSGTGQPSVKAVEKLSGFDVTRAEIAELWAEYKTGV